MFVYSLEYLTLAEIKAELRITDSIDDTVLEEIVAAAMAQQAARCQDAFSRFVDNPAAEIPVVAAVPADLHKAALLRASRLYARRASPEGIVPIGDLGVARVPRIDVDVDALEAPGMDVVLA